MTDEDMPVGGRSPAVTSWNADYVEDLYEQWQRDASLLPQSWQIFFQGFDLATCPLAFVSSDRADTQSRVASLIYAYRSQGHFIAKTDPLGDNRETHPDLELSRFGFSEADLQMVYDTS